MLKNGLDTRTERSRKQLKEKKNREKKIRGVKKNKAGDAAKKKNFSVIFEVIVNNRFFLQNISVENILPKGVIHRCLSCNNCQKVDACCQLLLLHDPLKGMSKDELGPQNELCGERRKDDLFGRVVDKPDSMLQNQVLTKQIMEIGRLHFGTGLGFIADGLPVMRTDTPYGGIQILVVERPDCNSLNSYKFF
ncbi:hypothetical protein Tco_1262346 [Tanacetum coccineum]